MPALAILGAAAEVLAVAFLALILILGAGPATNLIRQAFTRVPLVGGYLASLAESLWTDVTGWAQSWARGAIHWAAELVWGVTIASWWVIYHLDLAVLRMHAFFSGWVGWLQAYVGWTAGSITSWVQGFVADQVNYIEAQIGWLQGFIGASLAALNGHLQQQIGWLQGAIGWTRQADTQAVTAEANTRAQADGHLQQQIDGLQAVAPGATPAQIAALEAQIGAAAQAAEAAATRAAQTAEAVANQLAHTISSGAIGALDQAASDAVIGPWQGLLGDLRDLTGALPQSVTQGLAVPQAWPDVLPASIPGILSMVVPAVGAVTAEVDRCLTPNCDALGRLGNLDRMLGDAALWAALVGLLAEAARNPAQAASDIRGALGGLVEGVEHGLSDLLGV